MKKVDLYKTIFLGALIDITFFFANVRSNFTVAFLGLLIIIIASIFPARINVLLLFIFLLPCQRIIALPNTTVSLLNIIILITLAILSVRKKFWSVSISTLALWSLPILYSLLLAIQWGSIYDINVAVKTLFLFLFLWHFTAVFTDKVNFESVATVYVIGVIPASLFAFSEFSVGERLGQGSSSDANIFSAYLSFAMACVAVLATQGMWKAWIGILTSIILLALGILTQSRSFIATVAIIILLIFFEIFTKNKHKIKLIFFLSVIFFIFTALALELINNYNDIFGGVVDRITNPRHGDVSGGRLDLWNIYYNYLVSSFEIFFFGVGSENAINIVGADQASHNAILEVLIGIGFIGFLIVFICLMHFSFKIYSKKHIQGFKWDNRIGALPFIVLVALSMTGHGFLSVSFITSLYISILSYSAKKID